MEAHMACSRLKRREAACPDEAPVQLNQDMDTENLENVLKQFNSLWGCARNSEALRARVVLIFEKGTRGT